MKKSVGSFLAAALVLVLMGFAGSTPAFASIPGNDDFANATVISSLPFSATGVDATGATIEANEPLLGCYSTEGTVWYTITPTADEVIDVNTNFSSYGTVVSVYSGTAINALNFEGCNYSSPMRFHAVAGTTYYIQVAGIFSSGTLNISVASVPPPANDDLGDAAVVTSVPFADNRDPVGATLETSEPSPSCAVFGPPNNSWWYSFTPSSSGSYTVDTYSGSVLTTAVYTGATLGSLTEHACMSQGGETRTSFAATQGVTYYIQVGDTYGGSYGSASLSLDIAPSPTAGFVGFPAEPSTSDVVQFLGQSSDPGGSRITQESYSFGDGTTAVGCCPDTIGDIDATHQYAKDGDYTVIVTATTADGRTATYQQVVRVATHDVSVTQLSTPMAAKKGQTKPVSVTVRNSRYAETVRVDFYKSTGGGFELVGSQTQAVPARGAQHPTSFAINYTFTATDAAAGKIVFQAVATIDGHPDSFPVDNTATPAPVKVNP